MSDDRHAVLQGGFEKEIAAGGHGIQAMILRLQFERAETILLTATAYFVPKLALAAYRDPGMPRP